MPRSPSNLSPFAPARKKRRSGKPDLFECFVCSKMFALEALDTHYSVVHPLVVELHFDSAENQRVHRDHVDEEFVCPCGRFASTSHIDMLTHAMEHSQQSPIQDDSSVSQYSPSADSEQEDPVSVFDSDDSVTVLGANIPGHVKGSVRTEKDPFASDPGDTPHPATFTVPAGPVVLGSTPPSPSPSPLADKVPATAKPAPHVPQEYIQGECPSMRQVPLLTTTVESQATYDIPLVDGMPLSDFGLAYHPALKVFICLEHATCVRAGEMATHLSGQHKIKVTTQDLDALFDEFPPHTGHHPALPLFANKLPMVKIPGLDVIANGYSCKVTDCHYAAGTLKSVRNHFSANHRGLRIADHTAHPVPVQQLYQFGVRTMFPVQLPAAPIVGITPFSVFLNSLPEQLERPIAAQATRDEDSFMRRSDWVRHVTGFKATDLVKLVAMPKSATEEPELALAAKYIGLYLRDIQDTLQHSKSIFLLKLLNSDSATNLNSVPFRPVQQESTVKQYTIRFTQLLAFIVRCHQKLVPAYSLPLSPGQHELATALLAGLQEKCTNEEFNTVFEPLMHSLLTEMTPKAVVDPWQYPLHCFVALLHLNSNGSFAPVTDVTCNLAAIQWCFKCLVFSHIQGKVLSRDITDTAEDIIRKECEVLHINRISPYASLLETRQLANAVAYKEKSLPNVYWAPGAEPTLSVNGATLSLSNIQKTIGAQESLAKDHLLNNLLAGLTLADLPITGDNGMPLFDDLPEDQPGFSFLTDGRNPFHAKKWAIIKHILEHHGSDYHSGVINTRIAWKTTVLNKYLQAGATFMDLVAPLIHLTYGGPARRTELMTIKIANQPGVMRNIYYIFDRITLVTRYHKGSNQYGMDKVIPRFLPDSVSKLLIVYLAYVRPVEVYFLQALGQHAAAKVHETYLFSAAGKQWDPNHLTAVLGTTFLRNTNVHVNSQTWRQMAVAISNKRRINLFATPKDSVQDLQAAHTTTTAEEHYAIDASSLSDLSDSGLLLFHEASIQWQQEMGYKDLSDTATPVTAAAPTMDLTPVLNAIAALSTQVNQVSQQLPQDTSAVHEKLDHLATIIHDLKQHQPQANPPPAVATTPESLEPRPRIWSKLPPLQQHPELHTALARLLPGGLFKSQFQQDGCNLVLLNEDNLLVVSPTASGKSLLWLLPAVTECERGSITVVVVPLRELLREFLATAQAHGIRAARYGQASAPETYRLVFVSVEVAGSPAFVNWLKQLGPRLKRIVFEEAHLVVTATYRDAMKSLTLLRTVTVPFLIITATAPPSIQPILLDFFATSSARLHVTTTVRPEISYAISPKHISPADLGTTLQAHLQQHLPLLSSSGQVLVFCNSRADTLFLADHVPNSVIHHSGMDEDDRSASIQAFRNGRTRVLITTSGLSAGVNFDCVEMVIHAGTPHSLIDFAQESGRAGRRAQMSFSHILRTGLKSVPSEDTLGIMELNKWITAGEGCRRAALGVYLDGIEGQTCDSFTPNNPCDRCAIGHQPGQATSLSPWRHMLPKGKTPVRPPQPQSTIATLSTPVTPKRRTATAQQVITQQGPPTTTSTALVTASPRRASTTTTASRTTTFGRDSAVATRTHSQRVLTVELLRQYLQRVHGACHYCLGCGILDMSHPTPRCPQAAMTNPNWLQERRAWKPLCKFRELYTTCFFCWLPHLDEVFHGPGVGTERCQFEDIAHESIYAMWLGPLRTEAEVAFATTWSTDAEWRGWLTAPSRDRLHAPNHWRAMVWLFAQVLEDSQSLPL